MMSTNLKQGLGVGAALLVLGSAGWWSWNQFQAGAAEVHYRILMDGETGEIVKLAHSRETGSYPLENPKTGKKTLYPTEICFWDQCAPDGTRVILNRWYPDKHDQPTLCPQCGHEVTRRNPLPPNMRPQRQEVEKPEDMQKALSESQSGDE